MRYGTGLWGNVKITGGNNYPTYSIPGDGVSGESLIGTIDGTNADFDLTYTPDSSTLRVYLNGVRLKYGTHYTISGYTITFITGYVPVPGDWITADYTIAAASQWYYNVVPTGTIDGTNKDFTIPHEAIAVFPYLNGARLKLGVHFTLTGDTISFTIAPIPGDWIVIDYETSIS